MCGKSIHKTQDENQIRTAPLYHGDLYSIISSFQSVRDHSLMRLGTMIKYSESNTKDH